LDQRDAASASDWRLRALSFAGRHYRQQRGDGCSRQKADAVNIMHSHHPSAGGNTD
jgi:hypothetical protein